MKENSEAWKRKKRKDESMWPTKLDYIFIFRTQTTAANKNTGKERVY